MPAKTKQVQKHCDRYNKAKPADSKNEDIKIKIKTIDITNWPMKVK